MPDLGSMAKRSKGRWGFGNLCMLGAGLLLLLIAGSSYYVGPLIREQLQLPAESVASSELEATIESATAAAPKVAPPDPLAAATVKSSLAGEVAHSPDTLSQLRTTLAATTAPKVAAVAAAVVAATAKAFEPTAARFVSCPA